jgi:pimeloyl-ACP methyl ester carboxylesterase
MTHDADGIAYDAAGSGDPPLVFVHGWCCDRTYFAPQFQHFAARHAVIALDLRGHGQSRGTGGTTEAFADDVLAVAAPLPTPPVVVGHSMGALVALTCAARPRAVRAAVLVDPAPILDGRGKAYFARSLPDVASDHDGSWRARFAARLFRPADSVRRDETVARLSAAPLATAVAGWRAIADFDAAAVLPRVHVPVLVITAGEPEAGLAERIPDLTLGRTVGAGHFVQLEVPDQVNGMIERFLTLLQDREDVA